MKVSSSRSLQTGMIALVVTGLLVLALGGYLSPLTRIFLTPFIEAQTWISTRYQAIREYITAPADVTRLRQQVSELEAENSRLEIQVIELQQQIAEAQVLSTLVDYARSRSESRYVAAAVIGYDTSPFMRYIHINRGSDDGLRRGMPVVNNQGLIGQIAAVTAVAARVQLIIDPGSSINVHLQQADAEAVLSGLVTGDLVLDMIPQSANVLPGDLIVTSGLGGNYPPNLVVGQVSSVRRREFELFQNASVQPAVDFSRLEIVLVITNFQPVDVTPLIPAP